jgi:hypothetical protein
VKVYKVRFEQGDIGEEHLVRLFPRWENREAAIAAAFAREMTLDGTKDPRDDYIFVRSVDDLPPDPLFERVLTYTFDNDPTEHHVRINKNDTPETIRRGPEQMHAGKAIGEMSIEGAIVDDDSPMEDWMSRTGSSVVTVNWRAAAPFIPSVQKFWLWTPDGIIELGDETFLLHTEGVFGAICKCEIQR